MSTFDWKATQCEERWFHALTCLLARTNKQQEAHAIERPDDAEPDHTSDSASDVEEEAETTSPRNIAGSMGKKVLKEKFLDRLAEVMAREMKPDKKHSDVFATGTLDFEHQTVVYLARNDGLLNIHQKMMKMIQIWLRAVASTGERRIILKDKTWSELVTWSLPRLEYYRDQLRDDFTILRSSLLKSRSTIIVSKLEALQEALQICCTRERTVAPENVILVWTDIITLCFELRYQPSLSSELEACICITKAKVMWRNIAFMGRVRSAFVLLNFTSLLDSTNGFYIRNIYRVYNALYWGEDSRTLRCIRGC